MFNFIQRSTFTNYKSKMSRCWEWVCHISDKQEKRNTVTGNGTHRTKRGKGEKKNIEERETKKRWSVMALRSYRPQNKEACCGKPTSTSNFMRE